MKLTIFDDDRSSDFYPITQTRSVGDLRCGILKLRQRLSQILSADSDSVIIASELLHLYQERHPDWEINSSQAEFYVNSRIKISPEASLFISSMQPGQVVWSGDLIMALVRKVGDERKISSYNELVSIAHEYMVGLNKESRPYSVKTTGLSKVDKNASDPSSEVNIKIEHYHHLADVIHDNARLLDYDFQEFFYENENFFETEMGVSILNPYNVWIGENVILKPGVVLDASSGPIVIDSNTVVMPNSVIEGPCYIGKRCLIKVGAKIYGNTSIGPVCKIGGELEGCIIQGYSNKQHDGFLGHAYLGEWVNLGADTNNSDLKNNYKPVSIYSYTTRHKVDSGSQFMGCVIGDHTKTGINCSINTGCVIGCASNLWGRALISDFIPDFSWGEADSITTHRFEAFLETAQKVKQRRKLALSETEKELYSKIYEHRPKF